jgi:hypothetical protein
VLFGSVTAGALVTPLKSACGPSLPLRGATLLVLFLFLARSSGIQHVTSPTLSQLSTIRILVAGTLSERVLHARPLLVIIGIPIKIGFFFIFKQDSLPWNAPPVARLLRRMRMWCGLMY